MPQRQNRRTEGITSVFSITKSLRGRISQAFHFFELGQYYHCRLGNFLILNNGSISHWHDMFCPPKPEAWARPSPDNADVTLLVLGSFGATQMQQIPNILLLTAEQTNLSLL